MKTDSETLRLGDEESPYFRQFAADMEKHGGVVFDASAVDLARDDEMDALRYFAMCIERQKAAKIHDAMAQGHEGPWTWCYQLEPGHEPPRYQRCLLDGKGVACG